MKTRKPKSMHMVIEKRGEVINFHAKAKDPFALAARIQDFFALFEAQGKLPPGSGFVEDANFRCKSGCEGHVGLEFKPDGSCVIAWDNREIADVIFEWLGKVVDNHEALIHACGHHGGESFGSFAK